MRCGEFPGADMPGFAMSHRSLRFPWLTEAAHRDPCLLPNFLDHDSSSCVPELLPRALAQARAVFWIHRPQRTVPAGAFP